ncbi:MAG: S8 family peptidase [Bacteroidales bacterium]|nr:S8 family peptidase [Bacteroidales bacterium]
MKKHLLIAGAALLMAVPTWAQNNASLQTQRKWSGEFDALIEGRTVQRAAAKGLRTITPECMVDAQVSVTDADAVAKYMADNGYEAEVITDKLVVVTLPPSFIPTLAERTDVNYIHASQQLYPRLSEARDETGVTKVTEGEGLETPFTGKGVVVGIIDQGFEYAHPAFTNRVVRYGASGTSGTLTSSRPTKDTRDDVGHATHVANIAAGSKVSGSDYYGFATDADLILISSDFANSSVLKQAKAIKNYAENNGQPWVLNMSFGAEIGPHDGSTEFDRGMSDLCGPGGLMVAAMGNSGGSKIHARRAFTSDDTPVYLKIKPTSDNINNYIYSTIWSEANDGQSHFDVKFIVYASSKRYELTTSQMNTAGTYIWQGIDPNNQRQYYTIQGRLDNLIKVLGLSSMSTCSFFFEVTGKKDDAFHAWLDSDNAPCEFVTSATPYRTTQGDDEYLCGEGGASVGKAVAVGSYNVRDSFTNINNETWSMKSFYGSANAMSNFTSPGPQLGDAVKPAVCAPGGLVISAFSQNSTRFSDYQDYQIQTVAVNGKKYYYGLMSGTSMASPAVTGILALWLEANPKLTYEDVLKIFQETARRDKTTGEADETGWNARSGYGKIDAYEGLKKALEMANQSGINEMQNTEKPVSFMKNSDEWKVLFNNNETYAQLEVVSMNGQVVYNKRIEAPRRGQEELINLQNLTPGVYVLHVNTLAGSITRKVVVK